MLVNKYSANTTIAAWNKKYATYIPRDYLNIKAGSCWVSDHAQIDIAVEHKGNVYFPWVTVFRDVKTSKWLGIYKETKADVKGFPANVKSIELSKDRPVLVDKDFQIVRLPSWEKLSTK